MHQRAGNFWESVCTRSALLVVHLSGTNPLPVLAPALYTNLVNTATMSETGSQSALVPIVPQGQMEVASTSGPEQGELPSYDELLSFYFGMRQQAEQTAPPLLPYEELQDFYFTHGGGQAFVLQLPAPADAVGTIIVEEDVVMREEAKQAFHAVKDSFTTMGDEHAHMK